MTDKSRASFMVNQVLRVVKESNLNYLVKETPYSAYVTIRKKFVRNEYGEDALENSPTFDNNALSDIALRQENISLKQRFTGLESDKAHLENEIKEFELKPKQMNTKNIALQEKVTLMLKEIA